MRGKWRAQRADRGAHAARGFVGGAAKVGENLAKIAEMFQCRTRLCGWCSGIRFDCEFLETGFNAARGFVGGAATGASQIHERVFGFNAARGFVGGAAERSD